MVYGKEIDILCNEAVNEHEDRIILKNPQIFSEKIVNNLVDTIVLGEVPRLKNLCYYVAYSAAIQLGIIPCSIQGLYESMGEGKVQGFTVPAINIRTLTYDLSRSVFRAVKKINAGAFIFEIANSEIGYTDQWPLEYSSIIMLAAIKEGYKGPVFMQGDHFQVREKNYTQDKDKEVNQLKEIIKEAINASFYNIDIDSSTLVDLSKPTLDAQQKLNYEACAFFTKYIRQLQPQGIEMSIGGEIGEVGSKNSTSEELEAFMEGYLKRIEFSKSISKISIQTGTSHGGVILPDGSIAKVNIDLDTLGNLSEIAREKYGMAGAVQHGASTLPNEAFHSFPKAKCAEIHLATQFQNMVYDYLPLPLKERIYAWLHEKCVNEKVLGWTDDQFIYKTRKKALGVFKKEIHCLPTELRLKISSALEEEFLFLFEQLNIENTKDVVDKYVKVVKIEKTKHQFLKEEKNLGVLEGAD